MNSLTNPLDGLRIRIDRRVLVRRLSRRSRRFSVPGLASGWPWSRTLERDCPVRLYCATRDREHGVDAQSVVVEVFVAETESEDALGK